jgi:Rrf2 family protein
VRVTARADYAVRAMVYLATVETGLAKSEQIATTQQIPAKFLETILSDLRTAGLIRSQRGASGGYRLAVPADRIAIADVIRAVEGPLASVRGAPAEELQYPPSTPGLQDLWIAVRAALRNVLEGVTVADVATGTLPPQVQQLAAQPTAWQTTTDRQQIRLARQHDR